MNDRSLQSKIVILGLSQSGKTSIRQVVFEGFAPQATSLNPATVRINRKLFNFAGSSINLVEESMFSPIKWMLFLLTKGLLLHVQLKIFLS
ncbi:MAG: hypothetical protein ACTSQ6_11485 [Candidatus Heimdallarchaeaceae archaeon]